MKHLTEEQLSALLDGALEGDAAARAHLESCAECRDALARLAAADASLGRALEHDPGDAYFDTFADRVAARLTAAPRTRAVPAAGWRAWLAPRRLALAGSGVALVIVAGLVFLDTRPPVALLQRPGLMERGEQQAAPERGSAAPPAEAPSTFGMGEAPPSLQKKSAEAEPEFARRAVLSSDAARDRADLSRNEAAAPLGGERSAAPRDGEGAPASATHAMEARRLRAGEEGPVAQTPAPPRAAAGSAMPAPTAAPPPAASAAKEAAKREDQRSVVDEIMEMKTKAAKPLADESTARTQGFAQAPSSGITESLQATAPFAHVSDWPAPLRADVAKADSLTRRAAELRRALEFDHAAAAWERVRERTAERTPEGIEARLREALARGSAWQLDPLPQRREAALQAVDRALANPPRDGRVEALRQLRARLLR